CIIISFISVVNKWKFSGSSITNLTAVLGINTPFVSPVKLFKTIPAGYSIFYQKLNIIQLTFLNSFQQ
ncbi:hypothetical protein, partial [Treponema sp. R80B11-R83G3]